MIRVILPAHLQSLAGSGKEIDVEVHGDATARTVIDALETAFPQLRGTIRDHQTKQRRPMVRFFVEEQDWSHESIDAVLPPSVVEGREPFWIIGAISGG